MSDNDAKAGLENNHVESRKVALELQKNALEARRLQFEAEKIKIEKEKMAHARWWQEDALVHNRLTWLLNSQAVLLAAYGYFYGKKQEAKSNSKLIVNFVGQDKKANANGGAVEGAVLTGVGNVSFIAENKSYDGVGDGGGTLEVIPWIGFFLCVVVFLGVSAARTAQRYLKVEYKKQGIVVGVSNETSFGGLVPSYLIPFLFLLSWGVAHGGFLGVLKFGLYAIICFVIFRWVVRRCSQYWFSLQVRGKD